MSEEQHDCKSDRNYVEELKENDAPTSNHESEESALQPQITADGLEAGLSTEVSSLLSMRLFRVQKGSALTFHSLRFEAPRLLKDKNSSVACAFSLSAD